MTPLPRARRAPKRVPARLILTAVAALVVTLMPVAPASAAATPSGFTSPSQTTSTAQLTWNAAAGAVRYRLWYGTQANGSAATRVEVTSPTATLSGLAPNRAYYVDVASIDSAGKVSAYTSKLKVTTKSLPVPASFRVTSSTATSLTFAWTHTPGVVGYRLWYGIGTATPTMLDVGAVGTTTVTGLAPQTGYRIDIAAKGADGSRGVYTPKLPANTAPLAVPTALKATPTSPTAATATWTESPGSESYRVYYGLDPHNGMTKVDVRGATQAPLAGLAAGTQYYVKVAGKTDSGFTSAYTDPLPFTTPTLPTPANLTVLKTGDRTARATWDAVPDAQFYRIYYGLNADGTGLTKRDVTGRTNEVFDGLDPARTYYFKIAAFPSKGASSAYSANSLAAPPSPTGLASSNVHPGSVDVRWSSTPSTRFYRIWYGLNADGTGRTRRDVTAGTTDYFDGLKPDTTYYFRIAAFAPDGTSSEYTTDLVVKTPPLTAAAARLNVATYNVFASTSAPSAFSWANRKQLVWNVINGKQPAVVGLQEASQAPLNGNTASNYFFYDQVVEGLRGPSGSQYLLTNREAYNCDRSYSPMHVGDGSKRCYGAQVVDQGASRGTRNAYDPDKLVMVDAGARLLSDFAETQGTEYKDRYLAWAVFSQRSTGKRFFFANTHLHDTDQAKRIIQSTRLRAAIDELNTTSLPVILLGDFNVHPWSPNQGWNEVIKPFNDAGYVDLLGTQGSSNVRRATGMGTSYTGQPNCDSFTGFRTVLPLESNPINGEKDCWRSGYDQVQYNGNNIDYIFTKGITSAPVWETVIRIDNQGRMLDPIASDHNMLRAEVVLP